VSAIRPRTLVLTERVPRRCRLRPGEAACLLEHHRTHLDLVPAGQRGLWRLTPRGWAGTVVAGRLRLVLRPKITLDNLFFLLDATAPVPAAADQVTAEPGDAVLDFLAGQFTARLAALAARGLHRGYRERTEEGPFLRGRLDVPAQLRHAPGRPALLHCRHDDFTADVPCNRALKGVAAAVLASSLIGDAVRLALGAAAAHLNGVQEATPTPPGWQRLRQERLPEDYPQLLDLGRLLLDGLAPGDVAGSVQAPAFLLDMERVWERHVTCAACAAFEGGPRTAAVQLGEVVGRAGGAGPVLMRPDVTVGHDGQARLVVDAKWKRAGPRVPAAEDLYQVLAYCTALGAPRAVLVYPGRRDAAREVVFSRSPIRVTARTLRVEGSREECRHSARRLGRWLARRA
jgi:5-methylcytosine-specific restriction enzyme subunit McrC